MKTVIDTTYLFPVVGFETSVSEKFIEKLFTSENKLLVSDVSIFEIFGKAAKFYLSKGGLEYQNFIERLASILLSEKLFKIPSFGMHILPSIAEFYKAGLKNLPDCIILATASKYADVLLTEDTEIKECAKKLNLGIEVLNWKEFERKYM